LCGLLLGRVEADLDVLLVDPLLHLRSGGQRPSVGLEQRVREKGCVAERGERQPSVTALARLAEALGVRPADLLAEGERLAPQLVRREILL
jgi:hypothetical protein